VLRVFATTFELVMATLVVDIETVGYEWEDVPDSSKDGLVKWLQSRHKSLGQTDSVMREARERLALSPFTGRVVSLSMYDIERDLGATYYTADTAGDFKDNSFTYKTRSEKEILEDWWEGASNYDTFVTYGGRSFLLPFIFHRSVINKIRPSIEIAQQKYLTQQSPPYHVDLMHEFSFGGAMNYKPSLQVLADAYGLSNKQLFAGEAVGKFFQEKKFADIARRNSTDVLIIKDLYDVWLKHMAPRTFINKLDF